MNEEMEYPSEERERTKSYIRVSAEVRTYLNDLYNQIQYEFCEQYEDEIKYLQQKVEQLENIRKEAIEYIEKHPCKTWYYAKERDNTQTFGNYEIIRCDMELLNTLNKGSD